MIKICEQIKAAKKGFAYVFIPCVENGMPVVGVAKGKKFDYAMYQDNFKARSAAK